MALSALAARKAKLAAALHPLAPTTTSSSSTATSGDDDGDDEKLNADGFLVDLPPRSVQHGRSPRKRRATSKRPASPPAEPAPKEARKRYFASATATSSSSEHVQRKPSAVAESEEAQRLGFGGEEGFVRFIESEEEGEEVDGGESAEVDSDDDEASSAGEDSQQIDSTSSVNNSSRESQAPPVKPPAKVKSKKDNASYLTPRKRKHQAKLQAIEAARLQAQGGNGSAHQSDISVDPQVPPTPTSIDELPGWKARGGGRLGVSWTPIFDGPGKNVIRASKDQDAVKGKGKARQREQKMEEEEGSRAIIALKHRETLLLGGIASMEVLSGSVRLDAATLHRNSGPRLILAPATSPLPLVEAVHPGSVDASLLASLDFNDDKTQPFASLLAFTDVETGLESLSRVCPLAGPTPFDPSSHATNVSPSLGLLNFRIVLSPTSRLRPLEFPTSWRNSLETLANDPGAFEGSSTDASMDEPLRILIRGAKRVGKSTFARQALHALLPSGGAATMTKAERGRSKVPHHPRIAFLDSDLGQPEFGVPGTVALHIFDRPSIDSSDKGGSGGGGGGSSTPHILAPSWISHRQPLRCHFLGSPTPRDDPEAYLSALADLISFYSTSYTSVPLIVNTQGWNKGLGADLSTRLERLVLPTHIIDILPPPLDSTTNGGGGGRMDVTDLPSQMLALGPEDDLPPPRRGSPYLDAEGAILSQGPIVITLEPGVSSTSPTSRLRLTAADVRRLSIMCYLHSVDLGGGGSGVGIGADGVPKWDFKRSLVSKPPFSVDALEGLKGGIYSLSGGAQVPRYLALEALNGSLAALVAIDSSVESVRPPFAMDHPVQGGVVRTEEERSEVKEGAEEELWDRVLHPCTSYPPPFRSIHTLGIVLVRSVQVSSGVLQLLTPLSPTLLHKTVEEEKKALGLIKGSLELPIWASLDEGFVKLAAGGGSSGMMGSASSSSNSNSKKSVQAKGRSRNQVGTATPKGTGKMRMDYSSLCGVSLKDVPYVQWPEALLSPSPDSATRDSESNRARHATSSSSAPGQKEVTIGVERRRVRRNVQRRGQR